MQTLQQQWTDTLIHLGIQPELAQAAVNVLASPSSLTPSPAEYHTIAQVWLHLLQQPPRTP